MKNNLYTIRKFILATTAQEALKIEKKYPAQECWLDEAWSKDHELALNPERILNPKLGFNKGRKTK